MARQTIPNDVAITGNLIVSGSVSMPDAALNETVFGAGTAISRDLLAQNANAIFPVNLADFRVWDALHTNLPGTSANDDLALVGGTFGTASPTLQSSDLKAAGSTTLYARTLIRIPAEYDDGETVTLRIRAGALTTVADTAMTLDVSAYKSDSEGGIGSDLCATAAQDINSLTLADKDFTITPGGLVSGDLLDVRIAVLVNDAATGTAVQAVIGAVSLLADIKG